MSMAASTTSGKPIRRRSATSRMCGIYVDRKAQVAGLAMPDLAQSRAFRLLIGSWEGHFKHFSLNAACRL